MLEELDNPETVVPYTVGLESGELRTPYALRYSTPVPHYTHHSFLVSGGLLSSSIIKNTL